MINFSVQNWKVFWVGQMEGFRGTSTYAFPYQNLAYWFVEPVRSEFSTHHTLPLVCGKLWPNAFSKLKCQFLIREYFFIFFTFSLLQTKLLISLCLYNMLVGFNTFPFSSGCATSEDLFWKLDALQSFIRDLHWPDPEFGLHLNQRLKLMACDMIESSIQR